LLCLVRLVQNSCMQDQLFSCSESWHLND
jgi:hypothetical protein